jgi:hypothetical protein
MTQEHPITPPPELVQQWMHEASGQPPGPDARVIAIQAARWGADMELDACCSWADATGWCGAGDTLRAACRPKPLSLEEQAIEILDDIDTQLDAVHYNILRRALEALSD